jgi:hypothetical protein
MNHTQFFKTISLKTYILIDVYFILLLQKNTLVIVKLYKFLLKGDTNEVIK